MESRHSAARPSVSQARTTPGSEPNVPGAIGARPVPKPNASRCAQKMPCLRPSSASIALLSAAISLRIYAPLLSSRLSWIDGKSLNTSNKGFHTAAFMN